MLKRSTFLFNGGGITTTTTTTNTTRLWRLFDVHKKVEGSHLIKGALSKVLLKDFLVRLIMKFLASYVVIACFVVGSHPFVILFSYLLLALLTGSQSIMNILKTLQSVLHIFYCLFYFLLDLY